jgi:hypothetical protein
VRVSRSDASRGGASPDSAVSWIAGSCMAAGAVGGFAVGWLYGRDQATTTSAVPWYAVLGLVVGVVLGLLVSIGSIVVLVAIDERPWASAAPLRACLAAAGAAVPITVLVEVMSGFSVAPEALVFCVLISAVPAGIGTMLLDRRTGRRRQQDVRPAS